MRTGFFRGLILLPFAFTAFSSEIIVSDPGGLLGSTRAPVAMPIKLSEIELRGVFEGRLQLRDVSPGAPPDSPLIDAQLFSTADSNAPLQICWLMSPGPKGRRTFRLQSVRGVAEKRMKVRKEDGQFDILESGKPVLRYNFATIEAGDFVTNIPPNARIYARPRSDYIHPLFGLVGEILTKDWSADHPHHRGIYWAWPEVDWQGNRGDLHALQHVFARPGRKCITASGPVFAQIDAENVWKWGDTNAIVRERALIRVYHRNPDSRILDLEFQFTALNEPVLLARRNTDKYGGLNMRFAAITNQEISTYTDATNVTSRRAWAEISGKFGQATQSANVVVLQRASNPDYPGEWVQFPNLNWLQPTFPASGMRHELKKGQPLVLNYRLWLHRGEKRNDEQCSMQWQAYHTPLAPRFFPISSIIQRQNSQ